MAVTTERVKEGATKAIQNLENGDSIRIACKKAGISVTSLYHNSSQQEREKALIMGNRQGRGRRVKPRRIVSAANSNEAEQLRRELKDANDYIIQLEHKLVESLVFNKRAQ